MSSLFESGTLKWPNAGIPIKDNLQLRELMCES